MRKSLLVIYFTLFTSFLFAKNYKLERVEPMFWWTGMKNKNLQIMVYGKNISDTKPELTYKGVQIKSVTHAQSPNYVFIDLIIDKNTQPGIINLNFKKGKKIVAKYPYKLKSRAKNSAQRKGFDSSDVIYLLMPDRFANGNTNNDNSKYTKEFANRKDKDGRHGGDIQGIINNLNYIKELGTTAIWSTPLFEDNQPRTSYHGYAITDYYNIDPRYGTNELYKEMVDKSHEMGLKIIMDMVSNHCGSAHWWMKDLPFSDWVHIHKTYTNSNHNKKTIFDPYASQVDYRENVDGWFDTSMPDLNQQNKFMLTYLIQNAIWWIEFSGIDGIRMDTFPYNDHKAMATWCKAIMDEYPNFNIVGECWQDEAHEIALWQKDSKNAVNYNSHLKSVMDFPLHFKINECFNEKEGWSTGLKKIYNSIANDYLYPNPHDLLIFAENHDTPRYWETINNDFNKYKLATTLLFTMRGIPQIYYGTEIGMTGSKKVGDGDIRRDFPGGWENDAKNCFTKEGRNQLQNKIFNYTSKLLNWRKNNPVIHKGKLMHFIPRNGVYVYFRYNNSKNIMVVINNSNKQAKLETTRYKEGIKDYTKGKDIISNKTFSKLDEIIVPAKEALIIELNK